MPYQANNSYVSQGSQLNEVGDAFSPLAACIEHSSVMGIGKKLPRECQLDVSMFCDLGVWQTPQDDRWRA